MCCCFPIPFYTAGVFALVVGGLLWKKATKEGAFAGLAGGLLFVVLGMNGFSIFGIPSDIMSCLFSVIIFRSSFIIHL